MIRFLLRFGIVVALAGLFAWLADRPGVVRIDWLDQRIEAPLAPALLVLFAAFALCLWLIGLLRRALRAPGAMSMNLRARRNRRGYESLSRGMIAIGAGDLPTARHHAQIAMRYLNEEPLARLLEVQTAQAAGDSKRVGGLFESMTRDKDTKLLGLRGLFNQARQNSDLAKAGKIAAEALETKPSLAWASNAILMVQSREKNWNAILDILANQRRNRIIDERTANRKQAVVLTALAAEKERVEPQEALQLALRAQKLDPALVPAALIAGRLLASQGQARKAARTIERTYSLQPHVELVRIYGFQKQGAAPRERLKRTEQLVTRFGGGEEGAVGVAEAAIAALDWDEARTALEPFLEDRPRARICALMAEIAEGEGDKGLAREWLARGMRAPSDPKWTADGTVSERWQPVSPVTGELGSFQWKVPVERLGYETSETQLLAAAPEPTETEAEPPAEEAPVSTTKAEPKANPNLSTDQEKVQGTPGRIPLPDDPGPGREDEVNPLPDDLARRLAGSS
jgi:HemY protein